MISVGFFPVRHFSCNYLLKNIMKPLQSTLGFHSVVSQLRVHCVYVCIYVCVCRLTIHIDKNCTPLIRVSLICFPVAERIIGAKWVWFASSWCWLCWRYCSEDTCINRCRRGLRTPRPSVLTPCSSNSCWIRSVFSKVALFNLWILMYVVNLRSVCPFSSTAYVTGHIKFGKSSEINVSGGIFFAIYNYNKIYEIFRQCMFIVQTF